MAGTPNTRPIGSAAQDAGRRVARDENDLTGATLDTGRFVTVASLTASRSAYHWLGYGAPDNETDVGRVHLDLQTTVPTAVTGRARFVVFESDDMEFYKAIGPEFNLKDLRSAVSAGRTDKPMLPAQNPGAREDQVLALEVKASNANGEDVDPAASDYTADHTQIRT